VEQFLSGIGVFQYLFDRAILSQTVVEKDSSTSMGSSTTEVLSVPFVFHGEPNPVTIGSDCITMSLLTRKNLSNPADVSELTLFRHAKEVEANSKKALALCLSEESPYKDFKGTFPSGTNWHDYITWVRINYQKKFGNINIEENVAEECSSIEESKVSGHDEETDVAEHFYFKGFFAFALWGYIPPSGGEHLRSSHIGCVTSKPDGISKEVSRASARQEQLEEKNNLREFEKRGSSDRTSKDNEGNLVDLTGILVSGRIERQKQRLFRTKIKKIEFELQYSTTRIGEICEELKEFKDDGNEDDHISEIDVLKEELKEARDQKKVLFRSWKVISDAEESRLDAIDIENTEDVSITDCEVVAPSVPVCVTDSMQSPAISEVTVSSESNKRKTTATPRELSFVEVATSTDEIDPKSCNIGSSEGNSVILRGNQTPTNAKERRN